MPLVYEGPCPGGQVGAAYVRWPDGRRSVLTRGPDVRELLAVAREAGIPAPAYELVRTPIVVQELLPGVVARQPSAVTVESMVEINRRCRGLLAGRTDLPALRLYLREDGPGFCLHGSLRDYDGRTRRLLGEVEEIGRAFPDTLEGDDLVHSDFHPENVLVDAEGRVSGVIDWDGAGRGNADFDLCTLRFDLARRAPELQVEVPESVVSAEVGSSADVMEPVEVKESVALVCWAHMSLRLVDWAIRHFGAADVTAWLEVARRLRPR